MWLIYAFLCALFAAIADFLVKKYIDGFEDLEIAFARLLPAIPVLWVFATFSGIPELSMPLIPIILIGIPLEITALLLITRALRISPLSSTIPFLSFTPVFLLITSPLIVNEYASPIGVLGVLSVVCGAYLLNINMKEGILHPIKEIIRERGSLYILLAAFIFSITTNISKLGIKASSAPFFAALYVTSVAVVLGIVTVRKHGINSFLKKEMLLIGFFSGLMMLFHMIALSMVNVSYMIAVKRSALLISIVLGMIFLKEKGGVKKLIGGFFMMLGITVISIWG